MREVFAPGIFLSQIKRCVNFTIEREEFWSEYIDRSILTSREKKKTTIVEADATIVESKKRLKNGSFNIRRCFA